MQILIGLIRPFKVILLDKIMASLDICVRQDILHWLIKESSERGDTIFYAAHIFDVLYYRATHIHYLTDEGKFGWQG